MGWRIVGLMVETGVGFAGWKEDSSSTIEDSVSKTAFRSLTASSYSSSPPESSDRVARVVKYLAKSSA